MPSGSPPAAQLQGPKWESKFCLQSLTSLVAALSTPFLTHKGATRTANVQSSGCMPVIREAVSLALLRTFSSQLIQQQRGVTMCPTMLLHGASHTKLRNQVSSTTHTCTYMCPSFPFLWNEGNFLRKGKVEHLRPIIGLKIAAADIWRAFQNLGKVGAHASAVQTPSWEI